MCLSICALAGAQPQPQQGTLSGKLNGLRGNQTATVILTNVNTGASQRIPLNPDGSFSINVPPGTYKVDVERDGFRQTARQNLEVPAGGTAQIEVTIEGGPTIEAVEVKASAPAADTTPPEIGRSYTSSTVRLLPVFDRNYQELIGQMTGITPPVTAYPLTFDPQGTRQFNVNGLPVITNDSLSDGTTIREPFTNTLRIRVLPDEAVQQLNVVTSNYSARTGFAAGSVDNVFVRPGTNGLHGSLFGFVTGGFFRARDPFNVPGNPRPTLRDRQFGGTIGGALIPDRMFFFGSYQGDIHSGSSLQFATVPTPAEIGGNFSAAGIPIFNPATGTGAGIARSPFSGATIPSTSINPIAAAYASLLPAPNISGVTANNFANNVQFVDRGNRADGKLDYHFTNNFTGFLRYGWSSYNARENSPFGAAFGGDTFANLRNHHASFSVAGNYRGIIAEFRAGYNRYRNLVRPTLTNNTLTNELGSLGFIPVGSTNIPAVTIEGLGTLGTPINLPAKDIDNVYTGDANFHAYRGKNQIDFGISVRDLRSSGFPDFLLGSAGSFTFGPGATSSAGATITPGTAFASSFASFLLGAPGTRGIFNPAVTPDYHQRQYAAFLDDTIRMSRLTAYFGVRYDVYSPVDVANSTIFNPATAAASLTTTNSINDYHLGNVAPRVGFAFRLTNQTVVRTGYAINYFPIPFSLLPVNFVGSGTSSGVVGSFSTVPFTVPTATTTATTPNIPYFVGDLKRTPYVQNYYFMIQQSAPWGFLLDAAYVGNLARQMPFIRSINVAAPGSGTAGVPFAAKGQTAPVFFEGNGLTSNYNALQVNLTKRLSKGASFAVAYTWSKALDYGTVLENPFSVRANYGPADWDRTQMLTITHVFDIPIGTGTNRWNQGVAAKILGNWKIAGLFHWATGAPFNIFADSLSCACPGVPAIFASAAAGTNINGQASFNPALFSIPTGAGFGNLGRNAVRGPDFTNYNLSLIKAFPLAENRQVELRAEAYNILNSTQYGAPYNFVTLGNFGTTNNVNLLNGLFGGGPRTFILGARILF